MHNNIVIGYRHTGIIVKNIDESLYFYKNILGLKVIQSFEDSSEYISTITGIYNADVKFIKLKTEDGAVIEILEYRNHPTNLIAQPIYNVGVCHIAFQVKDINQTYKKIKESGVKVISQPVLSSEKIAKVFFCLDPNQIRIELVEMLNINI